MSGMTWYLIESNKVQLTWVKAESELGAKRIHATRYGDDQHLVISDRQQSLDYEAELDTPDQPYRSLEEEDDGKIIIHEKRVNQAGSKGIYLRIYTPEHLR